TVVTESRADRPGKRGALPCVNREWRVGDRCLEIRNQRDGDFPDATPMSSSPELGLSGTAESAESDHRRVWKKSASAGAGNGTHFRPIGAVGWTAEYSGVGAHKHNARVRIRARSDHDCVCRGIRKRACANSAEICPGLPCIAGLKYVRYMKAHDRDICGLTGWIRCVHGHA